jgi:hypothetical protein
MTPGRRRALLAISVAAIGAILVGGWLLLRGRCDPRFVGTWAMDEIHFATPGTTWRMRFGSDGQWEAWDDVNGQRQPSGATLDRGYWRSEGNTVIVFEPGIGAYLPDRVANWYSDSISDPGGMEIYRLGVSHIDGRSMTTSGFFSDGNRQEVTLSRVGD